MSQTRNSARPRIVSTTITPPAVSGSRWGGDVLLASFCAAPLGVIERRQGRKTPNPGTVDALEDRHREGSDGIGGAVDVAVTDQSGLPNPDAALACGKWHPRSWGGVLQRRGDTMLDGPLDTDPAPRHELVGHRIPVDTYELNSPRHAWTIGVEQGQCLPQIAGVLPFGRGGPTWAVLVLLLSMVDGPTAPMVSRIVLLRFLRAVGAEGHRSTRGCSACPTGHGCTAGASRGTR